ncbi:PREDICTED: calcium release-activated calcium channel protein 1-like [Ceratosolen solmsi marchali]|uniref:Calcium release-activated calcium channel protein 1-like n=1 Tax=Ceratosolen solmsi marchali TaxID=326594 RepID=A0AAJ6YI35_9HYME|nr:PREDICTED: calcium release-activated calcium channel protein 1-like [Ceratosolen solmsi marchali]
MPNNSYIEVLNRKAAQDGAATCQLEVEPRRQKPGSAEEMPPMQPSKSTKSTQIDGSLWRLPNPGYQRVRPTSLGQLSRHSQFNELGYPSYSPVYAFSATQSEMSLSSRNRPNGSSRHTTVDMMKILPGQVSSVLSAPSCNCCCTCIGGQQAQNPNSGTPDNQDGPEGLSWRRLHMCRAKLKATATTSELLSGFAMVAMVELQINEPTAVPEWLFVMFAVCTTVLVSVHIFALMISTYLLPNVEAISKLQVSRLVTESPHERMRGFIELAWAFSTVLGLFLFLVEVAILCWVKFWDYSFTAATASTVIVIPVLIVFIAFAVHFYHSLVVYKCETSVSDMKELETIKRNLDNASLGHSRV